MRWKFASLCIIASICGLMIGSVWQIGAAVLIGYAANIIGTIANHRMVGHAQFVPKRWFLVFSTFVSTLWGYGSPLDFKAVHLHHHSTSDSSDDNLVGITWTKTFFGLYDINLPRRFLAGAFKNASPYLLFIHKYHWHIHICYAALLLMIDPHLVIFAYLMPSAIASGLGALWLVHAHNLSLGYQNFDTGDNSVNCKWLSYLSGGEFFHNNHHHDMKAVNTAMRPGEVDVGYQLLRLLRQIP